MTYRPLTTRDIFSEPVSPDASASAMSSLTAPRTLPLTLKKIFTPERLQSIAQTIFDWMRKYADEYKANSEAGVVKTPEEVKTDVAVAAADLAIELLKLTVPELKKKAEEYGVELDGLTCKDEILRAIMEAVLKKA